MLSLTLISCTDSPAEKATVTIGFVQKGNESLWREANSNSITGAIKARGWTVLDSYSNDREAQIQSIRNCVTQAVDVLILTPVMEDGYALVLGEAKAAGIPVILVDRSLAAGGEDLYTTIITSDFALEGQKVAEVLVKAMGEKPVHIVELRGVDGSAPAVQRKAGFDAVVALHLSYATLASETANFDRTLGKSVAQRLLAAHVDANVVFCHNDGMALGAVDAIAELKAGGTALGDIMVFSIDGIKEAMQAVLDGTIYAVCECNPLMGPTAVETCDAILAGASVAKRIVPVDAVYTKTDLSQAIVDARPY